MRQNKEFVFVQFVPIRRDITYHYILTQEVSQSMMSDVGIESWQTFVPISFSWDLGSRAELWSCLATVSAALCYLSISDSSRLLLATGVTSTNANIFCYGLRLYIIKFMQAYFKHFPVHRCRYLHIDYRMNIGETCISYLQIFEFKAQQHSKDNLGCQSTRALADSQHCWNCCWDISSGLLNSETVQL